MLTSFVLNSVLAVLFVAETCSASGLVVVRQDSARTAHVEEIDSISGAVVANSSLSFKFSQPYVEMTTDADSGVSYLAAFPDGYSFPVLYKLDRDLAVSYTWENNAFTFWDMQTSPLQSTLYGILVTEDFNGGMYGRTLSNYTADQATGTITATELYTLPFMWYVNASSFDKVACTYYALINNFPGKENSTLEQQLVVADFSVDASIAAPAINLLDINSGNIMLQFVAFSTKQQALFFSGPAKFGSVGQAFVGVVNSLDGEVTEILLHEKDVAAVGPLVVDDDNNCLLFYIKYSARPNEWKLLSLDFTSSARDVREVAVYLGDDYALFGAAGFMTF